MVGAIIFCPVQLVGADDLLIIDIHVHTAGIGAAGSGCFVSKTLREGLKFKGYLRVLSITLEGLENKGDALAVARLPKRVAASTEVNKAVLLAIDGIIKEDKTLDKDNAQVFIPNAFTAEQTAK
ncbi:MAG: hypothetical protein ACU84Q_17955 [Gammaproteobacteria bacterium]